MAVTHENWLFTNNALFPAQKGCQAEVGSASAMSAAAWFGCWWLCTPGSQAICLSLKSMELDL